MSNKSTSQIVVEQICSAYANLSDGLDDKFEVATFMETIYGRFRVRRVECRGGDMLLATCVENQQKYHRMVLLHPVQAVWSFDVVPVEEARGRIGFGS